MRATLTVLLVAALGWVATAAAADPPPDDTAADRPAAETAGFTLEDLESLALQYNPTLHQAAALIEMSRGKALQAGLFPNPEIGYDAEQIGAEGA